ncbi:hypothetical protein BKA67DRAFT_308295 [Truncatella angustata]|uniref:Uncharacterized protein n=1 Tax=Truncatella angustata TaxID=152316 RepID=A0A9P8UJ91_9PEZI|nr:uncharacterized protein BKA67DRAFT_308295 [Truncatella angustata]KAH6653060.1 hypothetical protein BKA67DRAFT_308295 [Truncatella angustata]
MQILSLDLHTRTLAIVIPDVKFLDQRSFFDKLGKPDTGPVRDGMVSLQRATFRPRLFGPLIPEKKFSYCRLHWSKSLSLVKRSSTATLRTCSTLRYRYALQKS